MALSEFGYLKKMVERGSNLGMRKCHPKHHFFGGHTAEFIGCHGIFPIFSMTNDSCSILRSEGRDHDTG